MIRKFFVLLCLIPLTIQIAEARDRIRIVGSQEVLPFIEIVTQTFSINSVNTAPALEVTGSGNGFQLFCKGIGFEHPDINVTSRPVTDAEFDICRKNGVTAVTEIMIGRDAIVIANSRESQQYDFSPSQIFMALAASVEKDSKLTKNIFSKWVEIEPSFPDEPIRVMGPPTGSATYDDFMRLIMERGCNTFPKIVAIGMTERYAACHSLRVDDAYIQGPRSENAFLEWLQDNPSAFAITRYSYLRQNQDLIAGNTIDGVPPSVETISNGAYPLTRPLYVYVKTKHVAAVKGLQNFLYELTNDHTIGPDGYLMSETDAGFVPLDDQGRNHARDMAISLAPMER